MTEGPTPGAVRHPSSTLPEGVTASGASTVPDRLDRPFLDPLFDRLFPPLPSGVAWGLDRVENALAALGDPHRAAPALHVGGTNGKGSVAATLASVLRAGGHRVGLYTSPHLCSLTERYQVDGRPVSPERLIEVADGIRDVVEDHGLTFFEASTVLAFAYFQAEGVDVQVIEVGLGGRLDATNVLTPAVSVLTNVDMDHAEYLGNTRALIAQEKAGIIKPGVPVVTAETGPDTLAVFRAAAEAAGVELNQVVPSRDVTELEVAEDRTAFTLEAEPWGRMRLQTPLVGVHQAANAALAVRALALLPEALRPSRDEVLRGLGAVRWPGRDQIWVDGGTHWLMDVAHNTAGVGSLTRLLSAVDLPSPRVALIGVLGDKDWDQMLPPLLARVDRAVLTQPRSAPEARRWDPNAAATEVRSAMAAALPGGTRAQALTVEEDFEAALEEARLAAGQGTVIVTGSCHTVGDALLALGRDPFPEVVAEEARAGNPGP